MDQLYQSYTQDGEFLELVAMPDRGNSIVSALEGTIKLSRYYEMAKVLPVSVRIYSPDIKNLPAVNVEIRQSRNGHGDTFKFIPADKSGKAAILEIARTLGIDLQASQQAQQK